LAFDSHFIFDSGRYAPAGQEYRGQRGIADLLWEFAGA
jgi:hypothetical protein